MRGIRVGIIGNGIIAHDHARNYLEQNGVTIAAISDINRPKMDAFGEKYHVPEKDRHRDFRELLRRDDLDAVSICLHNNLHAPVSIETLRAGKHCYCEKPMAGSYSDAAAMAAAAKETGKRLHIQLAYLYNDSTHAARKLIAQGALGEIYHARSYGYRRRGRPYVDGYGEKEFNSKVWASGGALFDMGVYHLSRLLYLLGLPKLERVSGQVYQKLDMDEKRRREGGFDVEELGCGFAKFENGLTMDILESWAVHAREFPPSMLMGSQAGLALDEGLTLFNEIAGYPSEIKLDIGAEVYRSHQADPSLVLYDNSIAHWIGALRGECELIDTKEIALQTMLVSEGIYRSSQLGREVEAEEIIGGSKPAFMRRQDAGFRVFDYTL